MPYKDSARRKEYAKAYRTALKLAGRSTNNPKTLAAYRENHRERQRKYNRAYYLTHKAEVNAVNKTWREANIEKVRQNTYDYRRSLKGRFVTSVCSKAKRRNIPVTLTLEQYIELVRRNNCAYCGDDLPPAGSGLDRRNSALGYTFENCIACCRACNEIRGHDNVTYAEMLEVAKLLRSLRKKKVKQ